MKKLQSNVYYNSVKCHWSYFIFRYQVLLALWITATRTHLYSVHEWAGESTKSVFVHGQKLQYTGVVTTLLSLNMLTICSIAIRSACPPAVKSWLHARGLKTLYSLLLCVSPDNCLQENINLRPLNPGVFVLCKNMYALTCFTLNTGLCFKIL